MLDNHYDVIVVGTSFSSSFFLTGYLKRPENKNKKILVLEAGRYLPHQELLSKRIFLHHEAEERYTTNKPEKLWRFSTAFGGGSNCWYGVTPRMLPEDFQLKTLYGVGRDWPMSYEDMEPHYTEAERIMDVSGSEMPYPMSKPFPLPAHKFSTIDRMLKERFPNDFYHLPTARSSKTNNRVECCNNGVCFLCPINSKFTILNGLEKIYQNNNVHVLYESPVIRLDVKQNSVRSVEFRSNGQTKKANGDLVILGANALFNPFIMLKSGLVDGNVGTGICEQVGMSVRGVFDNIEMLHGSTNTTGMGFNFSRGEFRKTQAATAYQTVNDARNLLIEKDEWLNQFYLLFSIEDIPQKRNRVKVLPYDEFKPQIHYEDHSAYAQATLDKIPQMVDELLAPFGKYRIRLMTPRKTEYHIQCSTIMGSTLR